MYKYVIPFGGKGPLAPNHVPDPNGQLSEGK